MSEIDKILENKPENLGSSALDLAIASQKKIDESKFVEFYDYNVMKTLYYIWKTYHLSMTSIVVYIEAEYKRKTNATYIKSKLIAFEKKLKKAEIKKVESFNDAQYCFSSEKPTKHPTFVKNTSSPVSTDFINISELEENEKTVVSQEEPAPPVDEKKSTSKKAEEKVVNNSLPKKKTNTSTNKKSTKDNDNQNKKPMSIRDKYPKKATSKEKLPVKEVELLDVEVLGKGYDSELEKELAERKVREGLLYDKLSARKRKGEKLTMAEDRALYNLTKIDFTPPADRDEITVPPPDAE